jgi:hypothetical protein
MGKTPDLAVEAGSTAAQNSSSGSAVGKHPADDRLDTPGRVFDRTQTRELLFPRVAHQVLGSTKNDRERLTDLLGKRDPPMKLTIAG